MKIIDLRTIALTVPHPASHRWEKGELSSSAWDQVIVRIETDEGLHGIGESYHLKNPEAVMGCIHGSLKPLVIGQDPFDTERLWETMFSRTVQLGSTGVAAISGIDTALWDIVGKATGKPIYKLIGGESRKTIKLYVGGHTLGWREPDRMDDLVEEASIYVSQGYKALKLRGGRPLPHRGDIESVRALRQAFGDSLDILIDANGEYGDAQTAIAMARELAGYNVFWIEDTSNFSVAYFPEELSRVSQQIGIRMASGGNMYSRFAFRRLISAGGIDVIMANTSKAGGISEVKKIQALASTFNIRYSPHCDGGLNTWSNLHCFASAPLHISDTMYCEWDPIWPLGELMVDPPVVVGGCVTMSDRPGLGTDLVPDVAEKFPFRGGTWFRRREELAGR